MTMQGPDRTKMCIACFHPGHNYMEPDNCPAARLELYTKSIQLPYKVGSGPTLELRDGFFFDLLLLGKGYDWAVETLREGDGGSFGITIPAVQKIERLISFAEALKNSELFALKGLGYPELDGDLRVYFYHFLVS